VKPLPPRPSLLNPQTVWLLALGSSIALALVPAGVFGQDLLNPGGWPLLWRFLRASVQPELNPEFLRLTLDATLVTLAYAVCGTSLSVGLGLVGGVLTSEVCWWAMAPRRKRHGLSPWWLGARSLLAFPRAIHELIWGLFFVNIWGLDPLSAILAIAIPFGAITAKVFSEILDETPRQPLVALLNSGVAPVSALIYGLLPQAFLNLLSYSFYRFECSIRSAAVLGIIGAGGLGYQILLSLQSLRYEQLWTFFFALFFLNGAVDWSSAWVRQRLGCPSRLDIHTLQFQPQKLGQRRDPLLSGAGLGILLLIPWCFWSINADFSKLWAPQTIHSLRDISQASFPPTLEIAIPQLLILAGETLAMSLLAIAAAGLGGMLLSFPAAHNFLDLFKPQLQSRSARIRAWGTLVVTRILLLVCRAIPAPIWALVLLFVLFPGILPGAIALGLHNLGILGRLMAEVIENLDQRPLEALKAQGAPGFGVFLYGVLPMALPRFLAYSLYRWEVCMRETVIVGLVGAGGLGRLLTEQLSSFDYPSVVVTLGCFVVLTFLVDWLSAAARHSLRH